MYSGVTEKKTGFGFSEIIFSLWDLGAQKLPYRVKTAVLHVF